MDINDRLYVEIHPLQAGQIPHPHPIEEARFDPAYIYKVLGMYNPSETSECYLILANPQRQIWFIPQRHLLAHGLIDSDELFLTPEQAAAVSRGGRRGMTSNGHLFPGESRLGENRLGENRPGENRPGDDRAGDSGGHQNADRIPHKNSVSNLQHLHGARQ